MNDDLWGIVGIGLFIAGAVGWIMNIISIANADPITGLVILRVVGIFMFPLGAVLGYL